MKFFAAAFILLISVVSLDHIADTLQPPRLWCWGLILFFLAVCHLAYNKTFTSYSWSSPVGAWGVYTAVGLLSMLCSNHWTEGLFDTSRNLLFFFSLFYFSEWIRTDKKALEWISTLVSLVILVSAVAGLFQWAFLPETNSPAELYVRLYQITGFTGHKTMLAALMLTGLPFAAFLILTNKGWRRLSGVLSVAASLGFIFLLQSRAAWLALVVFLAVSSVLLFRYKGAALRGKVPLAVAGVSVILFIASIWFLQSQHSEEVFSYQKSGLVQMDSERNTFRLSIWESTLELWKDHPVLGVGPGNWRIEIPPYQEDYKLRPVDENAEQQFQTWHRPHNDFLWAAAEKGIPGILGFLFFWYILLRTILEWALRRHTHPHYPVVSLFGGMFAAYIIFSFVSFPFERLDLQALFMLSCASVTGLSAPAQVRSSFKKGKWIHIAALSAGLLVLLYASSLIRISNASSRFLESGIQTPVAQHAEKWDAQLSSSFVTLDPFGMPYSYFLAVSDMRNRSFDTARGFYDTALRQHPNNLEVLSASALLYFYEKEFEKSIEEADRALSIFPNHQNALIVKAKAHYELKQYDLAQQTLERCALRIKKSLLEGGMIFPETKKRGNGGE